MPWSMRRQKPTRRNRRARTEEQPQGKVKRKIMKSPKKKVSMSEIRMACRCCSCPGLRTQVEPRLFLSRLKCIQNA
jgi:hypothetical protein